MNVENFGLTFLCPTISIGVILHMKILYKLADEIICQETQSNHQNFIHLLLSICNVSAILFRFFFLFKSLLNVLFCMSINERVEIRSTVQMYC